METSHLAAALMASPSPMTKGPDFLNKLAQEDSSSDIVMQNDCKPEAQDESKSAVESAEECSDAESGPPEIGKESQGRGITLQMLLKDDFLKPGIAAMTIEYLGQKFVGDLLPDGKIKSHETETIFCSPSAWAIHCKRIINPEKRSGCGWASVKYRGKKLDTIKATYLTKKQLARESYQSDNEELMETEEVESPPEPPPRRTVFKHNTINSRMIVHDMNTLVEAVQFSTLGKVQPFSVSISSNALLTIDLHCHLKTEEVCGYLGGTWDANSQTLTITHTFPCLISKNEDKPLVLIESEIQEEMESLDLAPVGWYHSHATNVAMPSLQDCDKQLDFQMKLRGPTDQSYTPCVGVICSPYDPESQTLESSINCFYCLPPPEHRLAEYPRPYIVQYTLSHDTHLTNQGMNQIRKTIKYYLKYKDDACVKFQNNMTPETTFLQKLNATLKTKFPKGQSDGLMWHFIRDELGCSSEGDDKIDLDALLAVPQPIPIPKSSSPAVRTSVSRSETPPKKTKESKEQNNGMEALLDMTSRLTNSFTGSKNDVPTSTSMPYSSRYDMLANMSLGGGASGLPPLDSASANKLISELTNALPPGLAASLNSNKMLDPATYAQTLQSLTGGKGDTSLANLSNPLSSMSQSLLMNPLELADALYSQRKYSGSSMLGIPDPLSKSTLAANNMFLSPALFNFSDSILKPPSSSKSSHGSSKKSSSYKSMKDFLPPDYGSYERKMDSAKVSSTKSTKDDRSSVDSHASDITNTSSYLSQMLEMTKGAANFAESSDYSLEALKLMNSFSSGMMSQPSHHAKHQSEQDVPANFSNKHDIGGNNQDEGQDLRMPSQEGTYDMSMRNKHTEN